MSRWALERWAPEFGSWIVVATFDTKAEARARGFELRLARSRVREVEAIDPR
jgi:hypothetical protein